MTPAHSETYPWHQKLPRLGSPEEFATLRALLDACHYNNADICRYVKVDDLTKREVGPVAPLIGKVMDSAVEAMIYLFGDCIYVREDELARLLPPGGLDTLWSFDLIARDPEMPGMVFATCAILPIERDLTVCDRGNAPDGSRCTLPPDVVYPAIFENTKQFLARLPETPCEAMLDIGTGTGIAAMRGARHATRVWASDISSRCELFTEFNRRLANLDNMTVVLGDMYQPVEGLTFDRIVTHPPYIPAKETGLIFRDGGEDGEQIVRRVIEGLPAFLRPGGDFYALLMMTDREGEEVEQRLRRWLGPAQGEFDVMVFSDWIRTPAQMLAQPYSKASSDTPEGRRFRAAMWEATKTTYIFYGWILIRRHHGGRPAATGRAQTGANYHPRMMEWLLEWESAAAAPDGVEMLMACRPAISPHCTLKTIHRVQEGRFRGAEFALEAGRPFDSALQCQGWLAQVVSQCDGRKSWREHFVSARDSGLIDQAETPADFALVLRNLVSGGILTVAERPWPE